MIDTSGTPRRAWQEARRLPAALGAGTLVIVLLVEFQLESVFEFDFELDHLILQL